MKTSKNTKTQMKLSVILPCYNEGAIVETMIQKTDHILQSRFKKGEYQIIAVNDGSTDNTLHHLEETNKKIPQLKIISYKQNHGKGHAVKTGVEKADGDVIAFIDSDMEIPPQLLIAYYEKLTREGKDIVIGSKRHQKSIAQRNIFRNFLSGLSNKMVEVLFQLKGIDTQVGLKIFRKSVAQNAMKKVKTNGFAFDIEFLVLARKAGFQVSTAPVYIDQRQAKSHVGGTSILKAFLDTMRLHRRMQKSVRNHSMFFGALRFALLAVLFLPLEFVIKTIAEA